VVFVEITLIKCQHRILRIKIMLFRHFTLFQPLLYFEEKLG